LPAEYPTEVLLQIRDQHLANVAGIAASPYVISSPRGTSRIQWALSEWSKQRTNGDEEFWQERFTNWPEWLGSVARGRAFVLNSKCYVGGKAITNHGGNIADFLVQHSGDVVVVEIKAPMTKLLGAKYRGIYPASRELSGAITQALNYRLSLLSELPTLRFNSPNLTVHSPSIFVLAGDAEREFSSEPQRRSFELFRQSLKDVTIQTYDELFDGIANLNVWMEPLTPE
jgi:hypothetical protein